MRSPCAGCSAARCVTGCGRRCPMEGHEDWLRQIEAEVEGELSLAGRAALARHLEVRAAMASAAGDPHARALPRHGPPRGRTLALLGAALLLAGVGLGWGLHARWGGPGGDLEASRAAIVAR